jgi:cyclase
MAPYAKIRHACDLDYGDDTAVIPGHGVLSDRAGVMKTLAMLKGMRSIGAKAVADGMSLEAFLESNPSADYDKDFAAREDAGRTFATRVYLELSGE